MRYQFGGPTASGLNIDEAFPKPDRLSALSWARAMRCGMRYFNRSTARNGRRMAAIAVGILDTQVPTIETIIAAVNAGELDGNLGQMGLTSPVQKSQK